MTGSAGLTGARGAPPPRLHRGKPPRSAIDCLRVLHAAPQSRNEIEVGSPAPAGLDLELHRLALWPEAGRRRITQRRRAPNTPSAKRPVAGRCRERPGRFCFRGAAAALVMAAPGRASAAFHAGPPGPCHRWALARPLARPGHRGVCCGPGCFWCSGLGPVLQNGPADCRRAGRLVGLHHHRRHLGVADPGAIVWDEIVANGSVLWLATPMGLWAVRGLCLCSCFFDALGPAPWPGLTACSGFCWRGGWGILFDDFVVSCFARCW